MKQPTFYGSCATPRAPYTATERWTIPRSALRVLLSCEVDNIDSGPVSWGCGNEGPSGCAQY